MFELNKFSYMLKSSFHFAINLPEYGSLADEKPDPRPVVDEPMSLECVSGASS